MLCEAAAQEPLPEAAESAVLTKVYKHGKTKILLYRVEAADVCE
jgi:hypothetical protein